jgi:hypothetical protein
VKTIFSRLYWQTSLKMFQVMKTDTGDHIRICGSYLKYRL